jgi:hypothetical protein
MVTVATTAQIYLVSTNKVFEPINVATVPGVQAALGIVETCTDKFYVVGGNLSVTDKTAEPGSFSVWKLDMTKGVRNTQLTKVAGIPDARLLDRIMQWDEDTLFISDSILGVVWSMNTRTGKSAVVLNDTATMTPITASGVGVNYLGVHGGFLYYDNSERGEISRIPVDRRTGTAVGPAEVLVKHKGELFPQGFAFRGNELWLTNAFNQVMRISGLTRREASHPSMDVVAGSLNGTKFAGLSDCKFGSKTQDLERGSLYVSSIGKVGTQWVFGGSVWRVDAGPFQREQLFI